MRVLVATYVLIHGAGDVGWYWHLVEAELRARGHDTVARPSALWVLGSRRGLAERDRERQSWHDSVVGTLRDVDDADWEAVARLADVAVAWLADAPSQHEWVKARMSFTGERRHHVLESGREIVGYCAIELSDRGVGRTFRVFVVTDWSKGTDDAGVLYQQVLEDLRAVGANRNLGCASTHRTPVSSPSSGIVDFTLKNPTSAAACASSCCVGRSSE